MFKNLSLLLVLLSCLVNKLILAQNYYRGYVWACPTALRPYLGSGANSYGYWLPDNTGTCQKPPSGTFQNALNACTNGAASLLTVVGGNGGANNIQVCGCCYDNLQDYQNDQVNIVFPTTPGDETLATLLCVNTNAKCYEWATAGRCNDPLFSTFMNNVCPLSCTQCTRTTTCLDRKINCRSYVDYCEVDEYLPIMMFECPRTCGFCIQRTTTVVAPCMDYDGLCPTRYSLCSISTLSTAVQALCPLTCGVCVSNTTTIATPITTKSLPHLIPNIETIVEVCRDYRRDCASFLSLCDMPEHFPWLSTQCALSCRLCDVEPIPVTSPRPITIIAQPIIQRPIIHETKLIFGNTPNNYHNNKNVNIRIEHQRRYANNNPLWQQENQKKHRTPTKDSNDNSKEESSDNENLESLNSEYFKQPEINSVNNKKYHQDNYFKHVDNYNRNNLNSYNQEYSNNHDKTDSTNYRLEHPNNHNTEHPTNYNQEHSNNYNEKQSNNYNQPSNQAHSFEKTNNYDNNYNLDLSEQERSLNLFKQELQQEYQRKLINKPMHNHDPVQFNTEHLRTVNEHIFKINEQMQFNNERQQRIKGYRQILHSTPISMKNYMNQLKQGTL